MGAIHRPETTFNQPGVGVFAASNGASVEPISCNSIGMKSIAILLLLAACEININQQEPGSIPDAAGGGDAVHTPADEYLCGNPLPTTAPPSLRIEGKVQPISGSTSAGVVVEAWRRGGTSPLATSTAQAGTFTLMLNTSSKPVDGYLHTAHTGYMDTYAFPPAPFVETRTDILLGLIEPSFFGSLGPQQPNTGIVVIGMGDCDMESPVTGATISVHPAGNSTVHYLGDDGMYQNAPDVTTYAAVVSNVPAGPITIATENGSRLLRTGYAIAFANSWTTVELLPQ
jgi:hypothetical protein